MSPSRKHRLSTWQGRREAASLAVSVLLAAAVGCFEAPTGNDSKQADPVFAKKQPPVRSESVDFHIALADDDGVFGSGDALANDGYDNVANEPCTGTLYCEGVDFVGAHLSGGNNLMFWTSGGANGGQASVRHVRIDADGDAFDFHGFTDDRIFTNTNIPAVELGDLGEGNSVTTRMIVETEIGYKLKFGVDCFDADKPLTRVTVSRTGDVWSITPNGGAYLCLKTGKGRKAVIDQAFVSDAAFTMTMTKVGTS